MSRQAEARADWTAREQSSDIAEAKPLPSEPGGVTIARLQDRKDTSTLRSNGARFNLAQQTVQVALYIWSEVNKSRDLLHNLMYAVAAHV